jgi:hypothetical protein
VATVIARVGELLATIGRQAVPLNGLFARDWQPVTALVIYWFESLLLALIAVALCALIRRRASPAAAADAYRDGDREEFRAIEAERAAAAKAGIDPKDVAIFHIGGMLIFGGFFGGVLIVMIGNRLVEQRFVWPEVRDGAVAMMIVVAAGFLIDLWRFRTMSVADVQSRVDACSGRWALFWLVGFVGLGVAMFAGRPGFVLALFGGLKLTWEVWGTLANMFGWRSLKDREAAARTSP